MGNVVGRGGGLYDIRFLKKRSFFSFFFFSENEGSHWRSVFFSPWNRYGDGKDMMTLGTSEEGGGGWLTI